jgi:hypothetical protein
MIERARCSVAAAAAAFSLLPLFATVVATRATAQGTISDGNVVYTIHSLPPSPTSFAGTMDFSASTTNQLYQNLWFYRLDGDAREWTFSNATQQIVQTFTGRTAKLRWPNLDNRGIEAELALFVYSTGTTSGVLVQRMTIVNRNSTARTVNLFAYADVDACNTFTNSTLATSTNDRHVLTDTCSDTVEFVCTAHDRYEITGYSTLRTRLTNAVVDDLGDFGLPFGPGDYTGAFQWKDRVLEPNQSLTVTVALAHNQTNVCTSSAAVETYGVAQAGSGGPTTLSSSLPFLGSDVDFELRNGAPGASPILLLGVGRRNLPIPGIGTLWLDPLITFAMPTFDATGASAFQLPIPPRPVLCGFVCHWQAVHVDATTPSGLAHTGGLEWSIGGL